MTQLLAGDIGGTKTILRLVETNPDWAANPKASKQSVAALA
ncbi:MAG: glucokinase, partial [Leptolyngbya sp. SIO4C5]|nr:glucokinase [Leptolyngbya sp. SIO4C5]